MYKKSIRVLCIFLVAIMASLLISGCNQNKGKTDTGSEATNAQTATSQVTEKDLPWLEYTAWPRMADVEAYINNPNDVVTPYLEEKFKIKVKEVTITSSSIPLEQRLATFVAADNVPDVVVGGGNTKGPLFKSGQFADLTEYFKNMPNLNKYYDSDKFLNRMLFEGKLYTIPAVQLELNDPKFADDPYVTGYPNWALWVREDLLAQCGYKFTPLEELSYEKLGRKATAADLKIEPAIDTPEKYTDFLRKIKALNLKVGDKKVIPLSITMWQQFHMSSMFGLGHWSVDENGEVSGGLGFPGAKDWVKTLKTWYSEGLIDADYLIQKQETQDEKVSNGLVASGMYLSNYDTARQNMAKVNPDYKLRYIAWPKRNNDYGFFDTFEGGFEMFFINKKFKDIPRLLEYFDWMYSDEGLDLLTWGPESAGIWEMKDGKRVFKDPQVENDMLKSVQGGKGADYWGLFDPSGSGSAPFKSKAAICAPAFSVGNPRSWERSYPAKLDIFMLSRCILGRNGLDVNGKAFYGIETEAVGKAGGYVWTFYPGNISKLITTKSDAEFDKVWDEQYKLFLKEGMYEQAKKEMTDYYNTIK